MTRAWGMGNYIVPRMIAGNSVRSVTGMVGYGLPRPKRRPPMTLIAQALLVPLVLSGLWAGIKAVQNVLERRHNDNYVR